MRYLDKKAKIEFYKTMGIDIEAKVEAMTDIVMNAAFLQAVPTGNLLDVMAMLEGGKANINARAPNGRTALIVASIMGHFDIVKYLVENGADVNLKDESGKLLWIMRKPIK